MKHRIYPTLIILLALVTLSSCKHPLEIVGEGDIVDRNGSVHGCTLEQFQAAAVACTENEVLTDYFVNYEALPRPGWTFVRWEGPCAPSSEAPYCRIEAPAAWVTYWDAEFGTVPIPATVAVFEPAEEDAARVRLETNLGDIEVELYSDAAPVTVANFLAYVDSGFYTDTWFHRVVAGFVVQGGGFFLDPENPNNLVAKVPNAPIVNESSNGLSNVRGSLAMARTSDPDSATSQFYFNLVDNTFLDYDDGQQGYAVFALVVSGMDVVDAMAATPTFSNDVPTREIKILAASRVDD